VIENSRPSSDTNQMQIAVGETDMQGLRDQQENDRREQEAKRIATLPTDEQQAAIDAELALQCQYDNNPKGTL
jgi:hypothetical protein